MKTPVPDYLNQVLSNCDLKNEGALADYIPNLQMLIPINWPWRFPQSMALFIRVGMWMLNLPFNRCRNPLLMH